MEFRDFLLDKNIRSMGEVWKQSQHNKRLDKFLLTGRSPEKKFKRAIKCIQGREEQPEKSFLERILVLFFSQGVVRTSLGYLKKLCGLGNLERIV